MQKPLLVLTLLFCFQVSFAQQEFITTIVPFLTINPDARTNAMGQVSTVSSSEYPGMGLFGNPALLNQGERLHGFQLSYMPWLRQIVPNINTFDAGGYFSITDRITIAYNYHSFTLGEIMIMHDNQIYENRPKEHAHNMRFGYAISESFSVGAGSKFFRSSLYSKNIQHLFPEYSDLESFAFDAGFLFNSRLCFLNTKMNWQAGANVENLGPKAAYGNHSSWHIPSRINMGLLLNFTGLSESMPNMELDLAYQTHRLLMPHNQPDLTAYYSIMRGFGELLNPDQAFRYVHQVGSELRNSYAGDFQVAIRAGHFNEHYRSGNRKFMSFGLGGGYKFIYMDMFYWHTILNQNISPLDRTLGISIGAKHNF